MASRASAIPETRSPTDAVKLTATLASDMADSCLVDDSAQTRPPGNAALISATEGGARLAPLGSGGRYFSAAASSQCAGGRARQCARSARKRGVVSLSSASSQVQPVLATTSAITASKSIFPRPAAPPAPPFVRFRREGPRPWRRRGRPGGDRRPRTAGRGNLRRSARDRRTIARQVASASRSILGLAEPATLAPNLGAAGVGVDCEQRRLDRLDRAEGQVRQRPAAASEFDDKVSSLTPRLRS